MKIYTRTGDDGTTGLWGGERVRKDSARVEAYGTVDELNAAIGLARSQLGGTELDPPLARIQAELFQLGAELAAAPGAVRGPRTMAIAAEQVSTLEAEIDRWQGKLPPLASFILPGGSPAAAALHLARTVCRRAERRVLALLEAEAGCREAFVYLNRLSDHLFVAARTANHLNGREDVLWAGSGGPAGAG